MVGLCPTPGDAFLLSFSCCNPHQTNQSKFRIPLVGISMHSHALSQTPTCPNLNWLKRQALGLQIDMRGPNSRHSIPCCQAPRSMQIGMTKFRVEKKKKKKNATGELIIMRRNKTQILQLRADVEGAERWMIEQLHRLFKNEIEYTDLKHCKAQFLQAFPGCTYRVQICVWIYVDAEWMCLKDFLWPTMGAT